MRRGGHCHFFLVNFSFLPGIFGDAVPRTESGGGCVLVNFFITYTVTQVISKISGDNWFKRQF